MNLYRNNPKAHLDPLPSDYDEQLQAVDRLLSRDAASRSVPEGLAQRAYEASVAHLPGRSLKFTTARPSRRLPMISRLSMAAAVLLAVVVGVVFLRSPGGIGSGGSFDIAYNGARDIVAVPAVSLARSYESEPLSVEQEWVLLNSVQLAHYAEMRHLSWADVNDDLATLVREMEM
jgi:hypothetical protein